MKQLFYIVVFIILIVIAQRIMAKIKDLPEEEPENFTEEPEELISGNSNDLEEIEK
jgi:hypothetical protein